MEVINWLAFEKDDLVKKIRDYSKLRAWLVLAALVGLILSLLSTWEKTSMTRMVFWDRTLLGIVEKTKTPGILVFFQIVTFLGSEFFISLAFLVLASVLAVKRRKRAATVALLSFFFSVVLLLFLKSFFARIRPFGCLEDGDCLSFPSGHTFLAVYFYGLLDYLILRFAPISLKKFLIINFFLVLLVGLIIISRLYLNAHYPSDLVGGIFLGGAWLMIAIFLIDVLY